MTNGTDLQVFLDGAAVEASVFELRSDYRVALIAVDGIEQGPSDDAVERLVAAAESAAKAALRTQPVEELPHVAAWRDAYRGFGAKPQRTRNSLEALMRRAENGLPRVNRLADIYNAISVLHQVPIGGEDLDRYVGSPRLVRALGDEDFDTASAGETVIEHPGPGEVVWRDDDRVTCRRWNWRQGQRTQLTGSTTSAFFILDALSPLDDQALEAAADELAAHVARLGTNVTIARRTITAPY